MLFIKIILISSSVQIRSVWAVGGRGVAISSKGNRGHIGAKPVDSGEDSGTLTVILVVILPPNNNNNNNNPSTIMINDYPKPCQPPLLYRPQQQRSSSESIMMMNTKMNNDLDSS
ncbi:hypothetical protein HUG17_10304 [Dermatophagoides farinae]|uniref:Uncharacterized protein n=1 Tax=Dermatophagoides farinae TaxID=6954 RepID=A0A9D4NQD4_DERFA|nr:hypothetical protein HUG17_10304 [Dermatophagoides farinae]